MYLYRACFIWSTRFNKTCISLRSLQFPRFITRYFPACESLKERVLVFANSDEEKITYMGRETCFENCITLQKNVTKYVQLINELIMYFFFPSAATPMWRPAWAMETRVWAAEGTRVDQPNAISADPYAVAPATKRSPKPSLTCSTYVHGSVLSPASNPVCFNL